MVRQCQKALSEHDIGSDAMPSESRGNHAEHVAEYDLYVEAANVDRAREILAAQPKPDAPVAPDVVDQRVRAARRNYGRLLVVAGSAVLALVVIAVVISLV